jgi:hypothetical protein
MTRSTQDQQLVWTAMGVRMGYTTEAPQREDILAAVARIVWQPAASTAVMFHSPAVQSVIAATMGRFWRRHLHRFGITQINGGRELVGVEDKHGTRHYVIDLDCLSEAIHVLTYATATPQSCVA